MMKVVLNHLLRIITLCVVFMILQGVAAPEVYAQQSAKRTSSGLWYLEHLPSNYRSSNEKFPVIIFLHGKGERGNGSSGLKLIKRWGPPKHAENGHDMSFRANGKEYKFIVISPQLPTSKYSWSAATVDGVVNHVLKNYKVDPDRVYLTGLSLGGGGTWDYVASSYNKPNKIAAIAPVAGWLSGSNSSKAKYLAEIDMPVWAFHNSNDPIISMSKGKAPVDALKKEKPKTMPRFTVYSKSGHNAWTNAYATGHSVHSTNLYEWLLSFKRGGKSNYTPKPSNQAPIADAGSDQSIELPKDYVYLNGKGSDDKDGSVKKYAWKKISGPSATIDDAGKSYTRVRNLKEGTYTFALAVTDDKGATDEDRVTIQVRKKDEKPSKPIAVDDDKKNDDHGLYYKYYEGKWTSIPNYNSEKVVKDGIVPDFTLSPRKDNGFFGFEFEGYIEIKKSGTYTFYTSSDDGSILWIGNQKVVDNNGKHGKRERSGKISLKKGKHPIKVAYFENEGNEVLEVKYAGPGVSKRKIPGSVLYPRKGSSSPVAGSPGNANSSDAAIRINFTTSSRYSASGWNNTSTSTREGSKASSLKDAKSKKTNVSVSLESSWTGGDDNGYSTGKNSGVYPDDVTKSYFYTRSNGEIIEISGLDKSTSYDFSFFASTTRSGKATANYIIGSKQVSLDASGNKKDVVTLRGIRPDSRGEVKIIVERAGGSDYAYLNALVIDPQNSNARLAGGDKTFSKEEATEEIGSGLETIEISTFPNPVTDVLHIEMGGDAGEVATISLVDQLGKVVYSEEKTMSGFAESFEVNVASLGLNQGIVFLQINSPSYGKKTVKLLKN